jgi:predicted TIM-barrel fold metal-dependent hydrolase
MIPCVSVNPDRADATEELDRCVAKGARVLKIHPPIQGVDIARPKHAKFFRRCAEEKVLVMVHTGHEHSGPVIDIELARPEKLRLALDQGCMVVACHCGTGRPTDRPDMLPEFLKMLREYEKQGNLWGDTAVLGGFGRSRDFERLLADDLAKTRLLHGSDFPFPPVPLGFAGKIGKWKAAALQLDPNMLRQDFALKDALGVARPSAERAYGLVCGKARLPAG